MEPHPIKNSVGTDVAGGGQPPYDEGMEHRMTALETRFDTILPTLATKADVEALRAEIEGLRVATKADIEVLRLSTKAEIEALRLANRAEFEALRLSTKAEIEALRLSTKAEFEALRFSIKAEFDSIRAELEKAALRTDAKFAELRSDMHKTHSDIKTWMLATVISMVGTSLAAILAISQIFKVSAS